MLRRHGTARGWTKHVAVTFVVGAVTYAPDLWLTSHANIHHTVTTS